MHYIESKRKELDLSRVFQIWRRRRASSLQLLKSFRFTFDMHHCRCHKAFDATLSKQNDHLFMYPLNFNVTAQVYRTVFPAIQLFYFLILLHTKWYVFDKVFLIYRRMKRFKNCRFALDWATIIYIQIPQVFFCILVLSTIFHHVCKLYAFWREKYFHNVRHKTK